MITVGCATHCVSGFPARQPALEVVGEAGTAREALAGIGRKLPDLVVLDLNLPDQDGASLASAIRSTWPKTKILVLTGDSNEAAVPAAIRAGADGLIRKEDVAEEILRAIPVIMAGQVLIFRPGQPQRSRMSFEDGRNPGVPAAGRSCSLGP